MWCSSAHRPTEGEGRLPSRPPDFGAVTVILLQPLWTLGMLALRTLFRMMVTVALCASLAGCGFQLRGQASLPVETLYVPGSSPLVVELRRNLIAGTRSKLSNTEREAQATLGFTHELREKVILSFGTNGLVREFQLRYRVGFRLYDLTGRNFIAPNEIQLTRDISFNEGQVLAKESEEALLFRDMQSDMVQQIIRRLVAAKVPTDE